MEQQSIFPLALSTGSSLPNVSAPRTGGALSHLSARLDLTSLDEAVEHCFQSAIAPNSQRTYTSAQQRYIRFWTAVGLAQLPATEHQLCRYASFLASENLVHSTIKGYLSAIRHLQIATGLPDPGIPSMPKLEGVLRGIKATQARTPTSTHTRLPITPPIIKRVGEVWEVPRPHHALGSCNLRLLWLFTLRENDSPVGLSLRPSGTPYF